MGKDFLMFTKRKLRGFGRNTCLVEFYRSPLARWRYKQHTAVNNVFEMVMPTMPDDHMSQGVLSGTISR
jgi:hypothetical protein